MAGLSLKITYDDVTRAATGARIAAHRFVGAAMLPPSTVILAQALRDEAPVGKGPHAGHLRDSIQAKPSGTRAEFSVGGYARYVIHGTGPHTIEPRQKLALFWEGAGHPVKVVHHPGTKANDFVKRAVEKSKPALMLVMRAEGRAIAATMRGA